MSAEHVSSWEDCGKFIAKFARGLSPSDGEDLRQDVLLMNLEMCHKKGIAPFPVYSYVKYVAPRKAITMRAKFHKCREIEEWDAWYTINPENALDLKRELIKNQYRKNRTRDDLTNQVFGDWKVISKVGLNHTGQIVWQLRCTKCEEIHTATTGQLRTAVKKGKGAVCSKDVLRKRIEHARRMQQRATDAAALAKRRLSSNEPHLPIPAGSSQAKQ